MATDKSLSRLTAQCGSIKTVKGRKRPYKKIGRYYDFHKRYGVVVKEDSTILFDFEELPPMIDPNLVWTIVEGDDSNWYILPGFRFVNRTGDYIISLNARGAGHHNDYLF